MKVKSNKVETIAEVIAKRRSKLITRQGYKSLFVRVMVLTMVGYMLFTQVFLITQAGGIGMFPAIKDGDLVIAFRLQQKYAAGDVIAFTVDGKQHCGRIIADSNDWFETTENGALRVNGATQGGEILYPTHAREGAENPYTVPDGCVFVMGDYRTRALDSRDFGAIPMADVQGKVITILRRRGL